MPIKRRNNLWQVDVQHHGQRARQSFATKALAVEAERKIRDDLERQAAGLQPRRQLADALAEYLTTQAPALKAFQSLLSKARLIEPHLYRPLDRISDAAAAIIRAGAGLTPATINRRLALLRRLGNLAHQWGWTDVALGGRVKLLQERQDRHIYLTPDEVGALRDAAPSQAVQDAIWLAACTGLRRSELLALRAQDWRGGALWLATSKSGRPRLVPVPADAHAACKRLPLPLTENYLRRGFEVAREAAGLPHVRFHDLRHSYASLAIAAGVDLRVLKELMGHSTMQMTSRYAHLQDAQLVSAAELMQAHRQGSK